MDKTKSKTPTYNTWCVLYKDKKIIGYVHTADEADKICQHIPEYSWDYGLNISNNYEKRNRTYSNLEQVYFKL